MLSIETIPAQEIKRRGISAVDEDLKEGPVHVIKHNGPRSVVLSEDRYQELQRAANEAYLARVLRDLERVRPSQIFACTRCAANSVVSTWQASPTASELL